MANLTDADKILRNDTGKDIASKLDTIAGAIGAEDNTYSKAQSDMRFVKKEDGASGVAFDNTGTELESTNVEDVIKEIDGSLATVATSGSYNDLLDKPSIPAAQVNSDWNSNSGVSQILNKPNLSTVATTGNYDDLNNKPTIPVIDDTTPSTEKVYSSSKVAEIVENAVDSVLPTDSVSKSAIANFETDYAKPIDLKAYVEATQDLHGQSSPYPSGGQVWDEEWEVGGYDNTTGEKVASTSRIRSKNAIPVEISHIYYIKYFQTPLVVLRYDENGNFIPGVIAKEDSGTFNTDSSTHFIRFYLVTDTYANNISINADSSDHDYHPYTNICPIGGWDSVKVFQRGGNLYNKANAEIGTISSTTGQNANANNRVRSDYFAVKSGATIYFNTNIATSRIYGFYEYDKDKTFLKYTYEANTSGSYVVGENCSFLRLVFSTTLSEISVSDFDKVCINADANHTSYEPYNGTEVTIALGQTVYGGYVTQDKDGHRKLTVTEKYGKLPAFNYQGASSGVYLTPLIDDLKRAVTGEKIIKTCDKFLAINTTSGDLMPDLSIAVGNNTNRVMVRILECDGMTVAEFNQYIADNVGDIYIVYELTEPIEIDLPDGLPLNALIGTNNVYANSGDMEILGFKESVELYVQKRIAEVQALVLG